MVARGIPGWTPRCEQRAGAALFLPLLICILLMSLGGCALGGSSGKHIGMWQSIRIFDAQHSWASTYLAILVTSDGGAHWQDVTPWQTLSPRGHSATFLTPLIAWVIQWGDSDTKTPAQVYSTADGGKTWQHGDLPDSVSTFTPISSPYQGNRSDVGISSGYAVDAQHAWVVTTRIFTPLYNPDNIQITYTHLLQTSDGGKTWSVLAPGLPGVPPSTSPSAPRIFWATLVSATTGWLNGPTLTTLLVTHDDGHTWQQRALPALQTKTPIDDATAQPAAPTFLSAQNAILPITALSGADYTLSCYVTRDDGTTWTVTPTLTLPEYPEVDFLDVTHWSVLVTTNTTLYKTADGGQHWAISQPMTDFERIQGMQFLSGTTGWAIGFNIPADHSSMSDSDTVSSPIKTSDGGKTWQTVTYYVS
ncbi:MAG: hypothetical protein ACLQUY_18555 [Ktedonobacterales bacterium]